LRGGGEQPQPEHLDGRHKQHLLSIVQAKPLHKRCLILLLQCDRLEGLEVCRNASFLSGFTMFVPSLSWQMLGF
jgi:hypothetical protein